ncbi:transmembrane protein [Mycobacterium tuberculosis]|nr:transmembrane protein [Mycobacterium tuberculosis]
MDRYHPGGDPSRSPLLALRALANRPPGKLAAVSTDPVGAWRREDPATMRALAALELRAAGIPLRGD